MCIDSATFMHTQGGINVFTDVILLLYPLPLLPLLKFNKRQRSKSPHVHTEVAPHLPIPSRPHRHLLHRPHPRRRKHHAALRNRHGRKRHPVGDAMGRIGFKLVSVLPSCRPSRNAATPHLTATLSQDMGLGPRLVADRSRHRHPYRVSALSLPAATPRLERSQRAPHHDAEYGGAAEV